MNGQFRVTGEASALMEDNGVAMHQVSEYSDGIILGVAKHL